MDIITYPYPNPSWYMLVEMVTEMYKQQWVSDINPSGAEDEMFHECKVNTMAVDALALWV